MEAPRQLSLFARAHELRFEAWLANNPEVWRLFERFAFEVIAAGHDRYSADAICHRIRWHVQVETRDHDGWKVNNNHVAYLARRFARVHPEYEGFFQKREQKSA